MANRPFSRLVDQLRRHEGVRSHAYVCSAGYLTVGVGRNIDSNGGLGLSEQEIDFLLLNDISRCDNELAANFKWYADLDYIRKEALINICFNLGITRLKGFKKALSAMEKGSYRLAALEFLDSKWAEQVGRRAVELAAQIETGEYSIA